MKPSRPEVTFYRDLHLRQGPSSPAENASAGERAVPRRTASVPATNSGERMLAGGQALSGGRTSAKPRRPEVTFPWDRQLRQGPSSPAENASACERVAPRRTVCVPATNSGERMLAGGESLSGGRTSAKPRRPEVTFPWDRQLRQGPSSPAENASACERVAPRRTACVPATSSDERMLAGGESLSGGRHPAKPSRPEVTFYRDLHLRQGPSSPAENASAGERAVPRRTASVPATNSGERMLAGGQALSGGRTSAKPRKPEVTVYRDLHLRQGPPSPAENASAGERVAPRRTACVPATNSGERMMAGGESLSEG